MPKLKLKTSSEIPILHSEYALPTNRPVAVYYRQSTEAQVGNVSTSLQTVDMAAYLKQRGWSEENIYMIDMDAGISGRTKIEDRPGMRMLFDMITDQQIGTVACQDEDRLFRDVTQIQVNIFIEACRVAHVLVLTPSMVYDFANELVGTFHARQFRFKSEMAAEYLNTVIKGKLHRAKHRLLLEGRWAGMHVAPGYIVDIRKTLPDGSTNPHWRRLVPFEPFAEIVRIYFSLFLMYGGNLRKTWQHIYQHGPYYPDLRTSVIPEGFAFYSKNHQFGHGYCPVRTGLKRMLSNPVYIGHWAIDGEIVQWNNHPAIVPLEDFMRAYNYISPVSLDGQKNTDFAPRRQQTRPSLDQKRDQERPLCAGIMVTPYDGTLHPVGTHWEAKPHHYYAYVFTNDVPGQFKMWRRDARPIDQAIEQLVREKLRLTFDASTWESSLATLGSEFIAERKRKQAQVTALETVMANQIASLDALANQEMIAAVERRYEDAKAEYNRLQSEISTYDDEQRKVQQVHMLKDSCGPALEKWSEFSRDEKRIFLDVFVDHVEAVPLLRNELQVSMHWRDGQIDTVRISTQDRDRMFWSTADFERLVALVDAGATQVEIAAAFPTRTWKKIQDKIRYQRGKGVQIPGIGTLQYLETYQQYCQRVGITQEVAESNNPTSDRCS